MKVKIGEPRVYPDAQLPVLYPGEQAVAGDFEVDYDPETGITSLRVTNWLVEPIPGWRGRWWRWRYRLFGWFLSGHRRPHLELEARVRRSDDDDDARRSEA